MRIYLLISLRTQITCGECDSLATAQVMAEGVSGRSLEWQEIVNGEGDDIGINWLSSDGKWDISESHLITYEDACKVWIKE